MKNALDARLLKKKLDNVQIAVEAGLVKRTPAGVVECVRVRAGVN